MILQARRLQVRERCQQGFSLVELIIVMAILAMLAGIAVPRFTGVLDKSKQNAHDANVDMIARAAELYYQTHNQTRPTITELTNQGEYLKENPHNPINGDNAYSIEKGAANNVIIIKPGKCKADGVPDEAGTSFSF